MGIFSSILSKLGFGDEKKEVVAEAAPAGVEVVAAPAPVAPAAPAVPAADPVVEQVLSVVGWLSTGFQVW